MNGLLKNYLKIDTDWNYEFVFDFKRLRGPECNGCHLNYCTYDAICINGFYS